MHDSASDVDLAPVVAAARHDTSFLAARVSLAGAEHLVAPELGLDRRSLQRLLLCLPPSVSQFAANVHAIADLIGVQPGHLASVLRKVDAIGGLRGIDEQLNSDGRECSPPPATSATIMCRLAPNTPSTSASLRSDSGQPLRARSVANAIYRPRLPGRPGWRLSRCHR